LIGFISPHAADIFANTTFCGRLLQKFLGSALNQACREEGVKRLIERDDD